MSSGRQAATKNLEDALQKLPADHAPVMPEPMVVEPLESVLRINPHDIEIGHRIGFYHEPEAIAFGRLMKRDGQRTPIEVTPQPGAAKPWLLVVGRHRLGGAILEDLPYVIAKVATGTEEELREREASENLHRRNLSPIERAMFVFELCEATKLKLAREHGTLSQQKLGAKVRWQRVKAGEVRAEQALQDETDDSADTLSAAYGWQQEAADTLGLDKRTIRRALALYRLLIEPFPELAEPLAKHPIVGKNASQLQLICDVRDEAKRRAVIEAVIADPNIEVEAARILVGAATESGPAPTKDQKFADTVKSSWGRLSIPAKRDFLPEFVSLLTPDLKTRLRDMLDGELGAKPAAPSAPTLVPAVPKHASVKPDYIVCLEDGRRHLNLTMHLNKLGMTPVEYRARWGLPRDYPMVAPNHAMARRQAWRARLAAMKKGAM